MTANLRLERASRALPWLRRPAAARRAVVAGAFLALCVTPMAVIGQTTGLFLGPVTSEFGWTRSLFILGPSVAGMICGLAFPFLGLLGDRAGLRPVLLAGALAYGLSLIAMSQLNGSPLAYVALCTLAYTAGLSQTSVLYAKAISGWFAERRGLMLAIAVSGTGLGSILMPLLASRLIGSVGWRGAYVGLGLVVVAMAAPAVFFLVQEAPRGAPAQTARPVTDPDGLTLRQAVRTRDFWQLMLFLLVSNAALWTLVTSLAPILTSQGLALPAAAAAMSALGASQTIARLLSGMLLDRCSEARVAIIWYLLATAGAAVLGVAHSPLAGVAAGLLIGAAWGAENELAAYFTSRYFGLRAYGLILGAFFAGFSFGGMPLALLVAHLFDVHRDYRLGVALLTACLALSCVIAARLGPYRFAKSGARSDPAVGLGE